MSLSLKGACIILQIKKPEIPQLLSGMTEFQLQPLVPSHLWLCHSIPLPPVNAVLLPKLRVCCPCSMGAPGSPYLP